MIHCGAEDRHHIFVHEPAHELVGGLLIVRHPSRVEIGGEHHVAVRGKAVGLRLHPVVEPPPLLDCDDPRMRTRDLRKREVSRKADLALLLGEDPAAVRQRFRKRGRVRRRGYEGAREEERRERARSARGKGPVHGSGSPSMRWVAPAPSQLSSAERISTSTSSEDSCVAAS